MTETAQIDGLAVTIARAAPGLPPRPPLLFVHGLSGGAWYWARYQRFFADRGYTSYAVDLRGRGTSRPVADLGRVSMADYVQDALDVARALGEPPVVIGHSMGGLVAQKVAEAAAVRAAVLVCSAPPRGIPVISSALILRQVKHVPAMLASRPIAGARGDHDVLTFNRVPEAERGPLFDRLVPESGRVARELSIGSVAVDAARVHCPMLSVSAAEDRFVRPAVGRRIARKYGAAYRVFAGHAHFMIWEPGWERPAAEIERWVADAGAAA
jgi:pimeloyl-ACP methyl ester carboxylesterase